MTPNNIDTNAWQKATIIGSAWGAFEVVVGSILHNLAIPMVAGTILSMLGVIIMISGAKGIGGKGLFWRSALVCAALKTVSPSPVILTPIIGITLEGFLMEFGVLLIGNNLIGYLLGGGLAVASVLGFKLIRLVMIYGFDIVTAYESIFNTYLGDSLSSTNGHILLLLFLFGMYILLGFTSALLGYIGGKQIKEKFNELNIKFLPFQNQYKPQQVKGYKGGIRFLVFHILWIVVFVISKDFVNPYFWQTGGVLYIILCTYRYGRIRRMLQKPTYWFVIILISLFSSLFIVKGISGAFLINDDLLKFGFSILLRASVVIIGFSCINIELMSKGVSRHFKGSKFRSLANSYIIAQNALPSLVRTLKAEKKNILRPIPIVEMMFSHFAHNSKMDGKQRLYIITGDKQTGKTSFMKEMLLYFDQKGTAVQGFLSEGIWDEDGNRSGFNLLTLPEKQYFKLCDRTTSDWMRFGSYYFNHQTIETGNRQLENILPESIVFIDEIGLFELEGSVWAKAFEKLITENRNILVISVRRTFLQQAINKWSLKDAVIVDATTECPEEIASKILSISKT